MYFFDKTKKAKQLDLYLAKPNKTRNTIGKMKHIRNRKLTVNFGKINELTLSIPYEITIKNRLIRNPLIDQVKEKYLIKAKFDKKVEWFIISKITKDSSDSDEISLQCYSLPHLLSKDKMIDYEVVSYNIFQALTDTLKGSGWKVGYINPELNLKHRQFNVSSKTKLEFIYEIAETVEGIPIFDTEKNEVSIYKEEEISSYKGFWISYGKYLNNISEDIDSDEIITRLIVKGNDNLGIQGVNPTGQAYIDDFSYFLYPFEVDANGKIIKSSDWFEDDLALALVRYNQYVSSRKGEFNTLLESKQNSQTEQTKKQNELKTLEDELQMILDSIEAKKANGESVTELNKQKNAKQADLESKKKQIKDIETTISDINTSMTTLKKDLKLDSHLTEAQLEELSYFIHVEEWTDTNIIDENDLYEAGLKQLESKNSPPVNIKFGMINFFEVIEEQHNWKRFNLGDIIKIKHDKLNIWVKARIDQLVFDFDNVNIDVTISNTTHVNSVENRIKQAFYTINKVNTDYNNRKQNWIQMAQNFNLRNDRISEIPSSPTLKDGAIKHIQNDDGSINLNVSWDYPDFNKTKKNSDNIDGFWIYLYSSIENESYYFGLKSASESVVTLDSTKRSYTFPSFPSNRFYYIGVRAYRSVDDDISLDGVLYSDIIAPPSLPYLPSTYVNINGKVNNVKHTVAKVSPTNPDVNDVWISTEDAKTRVWDGQNWKVNDDLKNANDHTDKVTDKIKSDFEEKLREEIDSALEEVDEAMLEVDKEMERIENEVIPNVEKAIRETYIPRSPTPPTEEHNGLWWNTSVEPPRLMRFDEATNEWIPLAPNQEEVSQALVDLRESITLDYRTYTQEEILLSELELQQELSTRIGDVNSNITELNNKAEQIALRVSNNEAELLASDGRITNLRLDVDTLNNSITATIGELSNVNGIIGEQQTSINFLLEEISFKASISEIDTLTGRVSDVEGSITTIAGQVTLKANSEDVYTKNEIDYSLGQKVDLTIYESKMSSIDVSVNGIKNRVESIETISNNLTEELEFAQSKLAELTIASDQIEQSVSSLSQTVTDNGSLITEAKGSIATLAGQLEFKAEKTYVDTIEGRMTQAEGTISVLSDDISLKVDKDGLIGEINVQPGTVKISGRLIDIGDFTNLVDNGTFEDDEANLTNKASGWFNNSPNDTVFMVYDQTTWGNKNGSMKTMALLANNSKNVDIIQERFIKVNEGDELFFEWEYRNHNSAGTGRQIFGVRNYSPSKAHHSWGVAIITTNKTINWTKVSGSYKIPSGVGYIQPRITFENNGETSNRLYVDNLIVRRKNNSSLIVDGSIGANHIVSNSITAAQLNVNEIFSNSAVVANIRAGIVQTTELDATYITTGTLDATKISVVNLSASRILTGELDASKVLVKNLSASTIVSGELDASKVIVSNLNASNIISGVLNANLIKVTGPINIVRPDGAVAVNNGVMQGDFVIDRATPFYMDTEVSVSNNFFMTRSFSSVIADALYFKHAGRFLTFVVWARTLQAGCRVDLVNMDSGESVKVNATLGFPYNDRADSTFQTITIDLGRPTYRNIGIYLKFNSYAQGVPTYMRYTIKTISG
ncbi:phage tail protein [Cytobacillus kochii]|uniref:phage tail spike protein n=1 Tax=Cytobacillus kochii TaxID=859143 RepID=UPI001CD597EB|nr:phage tail spike protein [Cytobacillus kochii]MCA1025658.1 phage tail protein [Cytobacillus kochii]